MRSMYDIIPYGSFGIFVFPERYIKYSSNYANNDILFEKKKYLKKWMNIFSDSHFGFIKPKFISFGELKTCKVQYNSIDII